MQSRLELTTQAMAWFNALPREEKGRLKVAYNLRSATDIARFWADKEGKLADREYIARGPNCWGRGVTRAAAVKEMRKCWPTFAPHGLFEVFSCPVGTTVNGLGGLSYPLDKGDPPFKVSNGDASALSKYARG